MTALLNTQDLLYIVLAFAILVVAIFLAWALFELAKFLHQANRVVKQTRENISRVEKALQSSVRGLFMEGGKALIGYLQKRKGKKN